MKLSTRTRYGLRALVTVARNLDSATTSESISCKEQISKKYLDRLLGMMRAKGLLKSLKGKHGGYVLAKKPEEITLTEIMTVLEGPITIAPCVLSPASCEYSGKCVVGAVWGDVAGMITVQLDKITLKDIVDREMTEGDFQSHV